MKKVLFFILTTMTLVACEQKHIPTQQYEGVWTVVDTNSVYTDIIITSDSINGYLQKGEQVFRHHYTMLAENKIRLERCWLDSKDRVDYFCETYIHAWEDSLIIGDFCLTLAQVYPPEYVEIKLVRK